MPARESISRRGLLAVVGTSAMAGCSGFGGLAGERRETIRAYELPDVDEESALDPSVQPSVPVEIEETYLDTARDRTSSLLATLPLPLGSDDIPNGHIRWELTDAADDATDRLDDALEADTQFAALQALRRAREQARYAAAGWATVEDGLRVERVRRAHRQSVAEGQSFRENHEYVGRNLVRATLVHARVETALELAVDETRVHPSYEGSALLAVAAWGEEAESVRALVADARHLDTQFTASLPNDTGTIETTIRSAAEMLLSDIRSRQPDLPPEPTADEWDVEERLVADLRRAALSGPKRITDASGPASVVVDATRRLAHIRALQWVHSRLDEDGGYQIESAADIRSLRSEAYDALQTALEESPTPGLARTVVTEAAGRIASADWELSRIRGEARLSRFGDVTEGYISGRALARATPESCRQTVDLLRTG
ncbi:hypothetical protein [Salinigranum salinum]|uniref:hypothetical protein n=1 Tax=Salinigranum salinum TaxID=1364937 RepID=UPI00126047B4|nr:hypothetical protein [Salinigranum salinum]